MTTKKSAVECKIRINLPSIEVPKVRYDLSQAQIEKFKLKKPEEYEMYDFSYMPLTYRNTQSLVIILRKEDNEAWAVRWEKFLLGSQFGPTYKNNDLCYLYAADLLAKTQMELSKIGVGKDVDKRFDKLDRFYTILKKRKWGPFTREQARKMESEIARFPKMKRKHIKNLPVPLGMGGDKECYIGSYEEYVDLVEEIVAKHAPGVEAVGFDALALMFGLNLKYDISDK